MSTTLYASFADAEAAERAAGALLDYGVRPEDLSLVSRQPASAKAIREVPETPVTAEPYAVGHSESSASYYDNLAAYDVEEDKSESVAKSGITTTTSADAGAGAAKGAGVGLGVGALAALASMFVPGVGLVTGAGALATALVGMAGTTAGGAIAGGAAGFLKDQGMDSKAAEELAGTIDSGGALLEVSVPSGSVPESTVRSVLGKYEAIGLTNFAPPGSGGYVA